MVFSELNLTPICNCYKNKEFLVLYKGMNSKNLPITVKDTPQLSEPQGPGTSKLDWRYFEYNKTDRNELQVRIYLHKGTGTKMTDKLNNLTEKMNHFCSCAFLQRDANLEFIAINFMAIKVPPVQF